MTVKEALEECKRKYPVGTIFISLGGAGISEITDYHTFHIYKHSIILRHGIQRVSTVYDRTTRTREKFAIIIKLGGIQYEIY